MEERGMGITNMPSFASELLQEVKQNILSTVSTLHVIIQATKEVNILYHFRVNMVKLTKVCQFGQEKRMAKN